MVYNFEIFRYDKGIVVLQFLKVLYRSVIPKRFCDSPKLKHLMMMHELSTFCKSSHINTETVTNTL